MPTAKLIVVSVRLPVSVSRGADGWTVAPSPGGLATALRGVAQQRPFTWLGYPGTTVAHDERDAITAELAAHGASPVFLDEAEFHGFYEEFSNRLLWPLYHNLPERLTYDRTAWRQYRSVNEQFADAVCAVARPGDTVWVHDYQLSLVPQMLRARGLDCAIGYFLHIPFPSSETYRSLPVREEILEGVLGADLIGFHSYEYVSHFRSSCLRVLGLESDPEAIHLPSHTARLGTMPIGIEPGELEQMAATEEAMAELRALRERFRGKQVIVGVDRLDYTKGIPQKLLAFEELLDNNPELRDRVVLVQVASPSRMRVAEYQDLKCQVDELVGRINGRFGDLDRTPLVYVNQHVSRERLTALYQVADVALITPVRDGMNLVCLEYIAARGDEPGTLVLSEFAGAASCLPGARLVNPHNPTRVAEVLAEVLAAPPSREAFDHMVDFVYGNTSSAWAKRFLDRLEDTYEELRSGVQPLDMTSPAVIELVRGARKPLVLLDYDGTLQAHAAVPAEAAPGPRVREIVGDLGKRAFVYVVSGRPADVLDDWLGDLPIGLVCEHGLAIKHPSGAWPAGIDVDRRVLDEVVRPLMRDFVERTPGSKIEDKAASIAWHYRGADPKLGAWRAKELHPLLEERLSGLPFSVLPGSRVIEVRHVEMSKGHAAGRLLERYPDVDLVVCVGNDRTDEEMFEAVLRSGHRRVLTCRVGSRNTLGQYFVQTPAELLDALRRIVELWK